MSSLVIKDLHVSIGDKEIIRGLTLEDPEGRSPRHHGAERLRQEHAEQGHRRASGLHGDRRRSAARWRKHPRPRTRRARAQACSSPFNTRWKFPASSNANFLRAALQARLPEGEEIEATEFYAQLYARNGQAGDARARSPRAPSTKASPAARRSATRSCRWRCSSRSTPSSTRPTPASTSTR